MVFGVPGGVSFGGIFEKCAFFQETVVPSILNDSTAFWLDFEGPGLPETSKIVKKMSLEILCFFISKRNAQDLFFSDFGVHFGVSFGFPACK